MAEISNEDATASVVLSFLDGDDRTPLSSASVANILQDALNAGSTLRQIADARLNTGSRDLYEYAVGRAMAAHRRVGADVPEALVRARLSGAFNTERCAAVVALIGAATGIQYDRQWTPLIDPEHPNFKAAEAVLGTEAGRARVMGLVAIAAGAIKNETLIEDDRTEEVDLHIDYQGALQGRPSRRFPDQGDQNVQRPQLMAHTEARLRAGFLQAGESSPEVEAFINNLLTDEPTDSVLAS